MANIMNPIIPSQRPDLPVEQSRNRKESGPSFSNHLEDRVQERKSQGDKLGVENNRQAKNDKRAEQQDAPEAKAAANEQPAANRQAAAEEMPVSDALAMLMQQLQALAQDKELGPGQWQVALPDADQLQELAASCGMDEADITTLMSLFEQGSDQADLPDFLQVLINHFETFDNEQQVTTLETDLPMLETLLAKLGLQGEQISQISEVSVQQDGVLDLERFLAALQQLQKPELSGQRDLVSQNNDKPLIPLTSWETEQLQDILSRAGLNLGEQLELLPETLGDKTPLFDLDRLQQLLEKTIALAKQDQPTIKAPEFFAQLDKVLSQAGFKPTDLGMTPVIAQSRGEAYQDLLQLFDESRLRYEAGLQEEEQKLQGELQKWLTKVVSSPDSKASASADSLFAGQLQQEGAEELLSPGHNSSGNSPLFSSSELANQNQVTSSDQGQSAQAPRPFNQLQQQQILNQLSMAVSRGLKSGEHHLILKLHPAELGEVKVDLSLRNEQISVSFTMENSKVKQTLESSMEEFRQNMEQKGFNLGSLDVSVGQHNEGQEEWQRFELASWNGERLAADTLEDLPDSALYLQEQQSRTYNDERGISLFV